MDFNEIEITPRDEEDVIKAIVNNHNPSNQFIQWKQDKIIEYCHALQDELSPERKG